MQNLHLQQGTMEFFMLTASKYIQLLVRPLLRKTENTNMTGGRKLILTFYFMERTHEPLQLRQIKFSIL
jgi:hypothetical protein